MVFRMADLAVGYSKPLVQIELLDVRSGWRVAILGGNGVGETTLLRTMLGELDPMSGAARRGANVKIGYMPQTHEGLDQSMTALDSVMSVIPGSAPQRARSALGRVLLGGKESLKKIGELSGGQRSRVVLAKLMMQNPNVLMLDEPTNHLDIPSAEIMQDVLQNFEGTVIFVSHDRCLVQGVATHVLALGGGMGELLTGGWEMFLKWRQERTGGGDENAGLMSDGKTKQDRQEEYKKNRKLANLVQRLKRRSEELEAEIGTRRGGKSQNSTMRYPLPARPAIPKVSRNSARNILKESPALNRSGKNGNRWERNWGRTKSNNRILQSAIAHCRSPFGLRPVLKTTAAPRLILMPVCITDDPPL